MEKKCWYCIHFKQTVGGDNPGQCRRFAPSGLATQLIPEYGDLEDVFPQIFDATTEWCGDFQPNPESVPEPS